MYNTGELANFDPSMLQYSFTPNTLGIIGITLQISIIVIAIVICSLKESK